MPSQRKVAPAIVVAQGRGGYTVVFSVGELLMQRADPWSAGSAPCAVSATKTFGPINPRFQKLVAGAK